MDFLEKLKEQGWFLTEEGLKKLTACSNLQEQDVKKIISMAINWDFKDIASGALPIKPESNGTITGRIVLQIQKMRNISAPKANEESTAAPRFLQLELSDGTCSILALEFERISCLDLNLPPGTKLLLKPDKLQLSHGFLVLKSSDVQVLGGKVEHLVEKWEVARQILKYDRINRRLSGAGGPPPWIAFGKRLDAHKDALSTDKNFKSLQAAAERDKNSKENEEFNASRSQAIAEAAKAGQKKVFGGGQQNILDHNVKKILEKGYTEEDAKQALKNTNNNLERALYNLKRRNNNRGISTENKTKSGISLNGGRSMSSTKEDASAAKPQANVSLFDFLTDKLPVNVSNSSASSQSNINTERKFKDSAKVFNNISKTTSNAANKFENNMSSSFQANKAVAPMQVAKESLPTKMKSGKSMERIISNKTQSQSKNNVKAASQSSTVLNENTHSMANNNGRRNERVIRKESEQTFKQTSSGYQSNKRNNEYKISNNKTYQSRDNNRNSSNSFQSQQKQKYKRYNYEQDLDNLVESTSKMKIQNKKESLYNTSQVKNNQQYPKNSNQQQTPISKRQVAHKNTPHNYDNNEQFVGSQIFSSKSAPQIQKSVGQVDQPGRSFVYDQSKIVGFQNKEANEYAMNILKSQGLTVQQIHPQQAAQNQPQDVTTLPTLPPQRQHPSGQILNSQTNPAVAYMTQSSNMFITPCQQASSQFNVIAAGNWTWKVGDLCLAKYWDDGNYYDAKITAISEKTCVVLFLGYGNHEEVLKSDCLPITESQHIPINAFNANIVAPPLQQSPSSFQQKNSIKSGAMNSSGGSNQRYRGERQMYIPPPKRGNN